METIVLDLTDGIATVTISRGKALNALNHQVLSELDSCFDSLASNPECRAVILTGEGPKAFVAGADIKEMVSMDQSAAEELATRGQGIFRKIEHFTKPVIAAVNGFALGGGCELALACHIRIASENAKFGLPEVGLGLIPGYGGTQRLPRLVGKGIALEMILGGGMIDANRALAIGLANQVHPPEQLLEACNKLAKTILSKGPVAVASALTAVQEGMEVSSREGEAIEARSFSKLTSTDDFREGIQAFMEKRKANFTGK